MRVEKMPIISAGKIVAAASPKASATVCAAKPGGLSPSQVATTIATAIEIRAASSSPRSEMPGLICALMRSWLMAEEMASKSPAAVESAAARPPAAISAITQPGSCAISGLASTRMSLLTVSSLPSQPRAAAASAKASLSPL